MNPNLSPSLVPMTQSPWTYSASMDLPLTRSFNSSSSESSLDSGFDSLGNKPHPLSPGVVMVNPANIGPEPSLSDMLVRGKKINNGTF